jgi:hypothetical protein
MATRGIIAMELAGGRWHGRYAHWDNNPERMTTVLSNLIERDGILDVYRTLLINNYSWSVIDDTQTAKDELGYDKNNVIVGYGVKHDDVTDSESWYDSESMCLSWADYLYVMNRHGVSVYTVNTVITKDNPDGESKDITKLQSVHTWEELRNRVTA